MKDPKVKVPIFYSLLTVLLLAIQSSHVFALGTVYPDFMLLLTIIFSISRGSFKGELFGFGMGLLLDLMSGALFGLNAFVFTLVGACIDPFKKIAKLPNVIVFIFYIITVTVVKYMLYHIFFSIYQNTSLGDIYFFLKIPGEILINVIFGLILYIICTRFDHRDDYEWF